MKKRKSRIRLNRRKRLIKTKIIVFFTVAIVFCVFFYARDNISTSKTNEEIKNTLTYQLQGTPQMYGAKGDGLTDDTEAFQKALNNHRSVYIPSRNISSE